MIIIADAGSTKTHLMVMNGSEIVSDIIMPGMNPYYQTSEQMKCLIENANIKQYSDNICSVFHYGAGCANADNKNIVRDAWKYVFHNAEVEVDSDMIGTVRSLFTDDECGIACIIGTGSNSCQCEFGKITKNVPSLGFMLGDEGSGAYMGRMLVSNVLKGIYNKSISGLFFSEMNVDAQKIMDAVYKGGMPNQYLASFVPFIVNHRDIPELEDLVNNSIKSFFERNLCQYSQRYPLGFIGSLAVLFSDNITRIAKDYGFSVKKIEKDPLPGLCRYHKYEK